ncbi:MAG: DUF4405 domain-containing protein [Chloroflexota bacterium]|nr:DUF4405 domain-containing protein [Chloroflexota bacterium]
MDRDADFPSWRNAGGKAARLVSLAVLLTLLALLGPSRIVEGGGLYQASETKIEIRITGMVSAEQRARIDELLKAFDQQNPRLKIETEDREKEGQEKESKANKYLFFPLTAAMLATVAASTVLAQAWRSTRYRVNLTANVATAIAFGLVATSGVLLILNVELEDSGVDVKFWHVVTGTIFVYLIVFHLANNWRAWLAYLRRVTRWLRPAGP